MVHFKSKHKSLTFIVNGELKSFSLGSYSTDNEDEIKVLDALPETERVESEKSVKVETVAEKDEKSPEKPKARPRRKPKKEEA